MQETMDEDDRSASLIAIQEAHRIMIMHHCRQSWEDSERTIWFGLPLKVTTETPNLNTESNKDAGIGSGTLPLTFKTARQLDMEPLDRKSQAAEDRDPELHSKEAKKVEPLNSDNQSPGRDRKTGGAKGKQNIGTIATDTRPVATQQVATGRRKPAKAMDPHSTDFPLDTEAHKDATLPTQQQTHSQSPESPTQRTEDILTGSTQGNKSPNKSSSSPQAVADLQPDQTETSVNKETELPLTLQANTDRDLELLTGPTPQRQVDSGQGLQPDTTAKEGPIPTMPPRKVRHRKTQPITKNNDRTEPMRLTVTAEKALPDAQTRIHTAKKEEGSAPILTPAQLQSIAKRRRQQSRAKPPKNSTACFYLSTLVLKWTIEGAIWMPIYKVDKGDIVVQSLPSGNIEDLSGAMMTAIETVCTFDCPDERIDLVKMGEALITAHHHIQTTVGWMTARQAIQQGPGRLISNVHVERVYNLLLEGGGNIIINTTPNPQEALTMTGAATMGYRIEPTKDSQPPGPLTYPQANLKRLGQHKGMHTGQKRFRAGELTVQPNGDITLDPPISCDNRSKTSTQAVPFIRTHLPSCLDPATGTQLEPNAVSDKTQEGDKGQLINSTQSSCAVDTALSETANRQPLRKLNVTNDDPPEPILTADTYILTIYAGKANWTQLGTIANGTTVIQSLPSGQIEDLGGVMVKTIESISPSQRPTEGNALVRLGMACVAAHLHIKIENEWMTAFQATQRGHGTFLQDHTHLQLLSLRLHEGGNVLINTSNSVDEAPTLREAATTGYRPDLSTEPMSDRFITYPLHEGQAGERRVAQAKLSYCDVTRHRPKERPEKQIPPESPLVLDPISLKSEKDSMRPQSNITEETRKDVKGSAFSLPGGNSARRQREKEIVGGGPDAKVNSLASTTSNPLPIRIPTPQPSFSEIPDIYLRTPDGSIVPEHEARWEHNPYARECGDTSGFLGLKPGHYQLKGNMEAYDLCRLAHSDFYSQFFQAHPTGEPKTELAPPFSLGKAKVLRNQLRSASRLRANSMREQAERADIKPMATASQSTLSQHRERTRARIKPTPEEAVSSPRDKDRFHKSEPTAQIPKRGFTSRDRKRPGSRKRDRRREQERKSNVVALKEPNPETPERIIGREEPSQPLNPADYKKPVPPSQQIDPFPAEPGTATGAACFGPQMLLLVQNPMNPSTYDSRTPLTRPIEKIGQGCMVLAEKQDSIGRSIFFPARVMCLMMFEIPQEDDPEANKSLQKKILSKSLGLTITRHHHIRKYGFIHEQVPGGRQVITRAHTTKWCEAADLDVMDHKSTTHRTDIPLTTVTRVFNLVLDPPGNVVILAHRGLLMVSATLGYHMRCEPNYDTRFEGGRPVYTRHDALQLQGLPPSSPVALYNGDKERLPEPRTVGSFSIGTGQYAKAQTPSMTNQQRLYATSSTPCRPRRKTCDCCCNGNELTEAGIAALFPIQAQTNTGNTTSEET